MILHITWCVCHHSGDSALSNLQNPKWKLGRQEGGLNPERGCDGSNQCLFLGINYLLLDKKNCSQTEWVKTVLSHRMISVSSWSLAWGWRIGFLGAHMLPWPVSTAGGGGAWGSSTAGPLRKLLRVPTTRQLASHGTSDPRETRAEPCSAFSY